MTKLVADNILKSDRAMAAGDYYIAERYYKSKLEHKAFGSTLLSTLYTHFNLATIYYKTNRFEEAKTHYNYCIENGGNTRIKEDAEKITATL